MKKRDTVRLCPFWFNDSKESPTSNRPGALEFEYQANSLRERYLRLGWKRAKPMGRKSVKTVIVSAAHEACPTVCGGRAEGRSVTKSEAVYPAPPMPSITGSLFIQCYTLICEILHYMMPHKGNFYVDSNREGISKSLVLGETGGKKEKV